MRFLLLVVILYGEESDSFVQDLFNGCGVLLHATSILYKLLLWFHFFIFYILNGNPLLLPGKCQVVGDITKESTLVPEYFKGVRRVINAVSVIVGPKEGDTPDRQKYSQVCSKGFIFDAFKVHLSFLSKHLTSKLLF